jgi:hypothetical protein
MHCQHHHPARPRQRSVQAGQFRGSAHEQRPAAWQVHQPRGGRQLGHRREGLGRQDRHPLRPVLNIYRMIAGGRDPADISVRADAPPRRARFRHAGRCRRLRLIRPPPSWPLHDC